MERSGEAIDTQDGAKSGFIKPVALWAKVVGTWWWGAAAGVLLGGVGLVQLVSQLHRQLAWVVVAALFLVVIGSAIAYLREHARLLRAEARAANDPRRERLRDLLEGSVARGEHFATKTQFWKPTLLLKLESWDKKTTRLLDNALGPDISDQYKKLDNAHTSTKMSDVIQQVIEPRLSYLKHVIDGLDALPIMRDWRPD